MRAPRFVFGLLTVAALACNPLARGGAPPAPPQVLPAPSETPTSPPAAPAQEAIATGSPPTQVPLTPATESAPPPGAPTAAPTPSLQPNPTPDFSALTFVEKNNLYLELLARRQAEGVDTLAAEDAYVRSLEATFVGDAALADEQLEQSILLLWK